MVDNVPAPQCRIFYDTFFSNVDVKSRIKNKCKGNRNSRTFFYVNNFKLYFTVSLKSLSIFYLAKKVAKR